MAGIRPYYHELNRLYRELLGRDIDHSGYFTYAGLLESGEMALVDIERILKESEEYRHKTAEGEAAAR